MGITNYKQLNFQKAIKLNQNVINRN